jgi:hypothetical protein
VAFLIIPFSAQMYNATQEIKFGAFNILFPWKHLAWCGHTILHCAGVVLAIPSPSTKLLSLLFFSLCCHLIPCGKSRSKFVAVHFLTHANLGTTVRCSAYVGSVNNLPPKITCLNHDIKSFLISSFRSKHNN